jgi:hypothetical protein
MRHVFVVVVDTPQPHPVLRPGYNPEKCDTLVSQKMAELNVRDLRFVTPEVLPQDWGKPISHFFPENIGL